MKPQKLAALALASTLVLGACAKPKVTQGQIGTQSDPNASPTASAGTSPKPRASGGTTASASTISQPTPTSTKSGATPGPNSSSISSSPVTKGSPLASNALQPPVPGHYIYNETGSLGQGDCAQNGPPPSPTTLDISAANGNQQISVRDRAFNSGGIRITTTLEYRPEGIFLIYLKQEQSVGGTGTSVVSVFQPQPPPMVVPANPAAGYSWNWSMTSTDGKLTVTASNTIVSLDETITLGDSSQIHAVKSTRHTHITGTSQIGAVDLTEDATAWGSTAKSLIVKQKTVQTGKAGLCDHINNDVTELLRSTTPT